MKPALKRTRSWASLAAVMCSLWMAGSTEAAEPDFQVTTPEDPFEIPFVINGQENNPTLTLVRGRTYTFAITNSIVHPFAIATLQGGLPFGPPPPGVFNNNIYEGILTYEVPLDAEDCGYYCPVHFFFGFINFIDPPFTPTPVFQIVGLTVGTNLVLTSTGTNTWTPFPEFSTDLNGTNWFALTVHTNRFFNGTNETICGRPPADAAFIRIRSQAN